MTTQTPTLPDILDPPLEARDRLVVSGKTRMGKSELVKTILLPAWPRVVVIDAKKEYRKTHPDAPKGMRALEPLDLEGFVERLSDYDVAVSPDRELAVSVSAWGFSYEERSENFVSIVMLLEVCRSLHLVIDEIGMLPRTCWHAIDYLACLSAS